MSNIVETGEVIIEILNSVSNLHLYIRLLQPYILYGEEIILHNISISKIFLPIQTVWRPTYIYKCRLLTENVYIYYYLKHCGTGTSLGV